MVYQKILLPSEFNNILIQYFYGVSNSTQLLPIAYENTYVVCCSPGVKLGGGDLQFGYQATKQVTLTSFLVNHVNHYPAQHCITIGF